jgi:hypothetical protein
MQLHFRAYLGNRGQAFLKIFTLSTLDAHLWGNHH